MAERWSKIVDGWRKRDYTAELARADSIPAIATLGCEALFTHGAGAKPVLEPLRDRVLAVLAAPPAPSEAMLQLASIICIHELVGLSLGARPYEAIRAQLPEVRTSRDAPAVHTHWNKALIGLALDEPAVWRGILGLADDSENPFVPGQTFQFNVWGTIRHFVAARATHAHAMQAWREFVVCVPTLIEAGSINLETLLWMGRYVMYRNKLHDIGDLFPVIVSWAATQ
jgi:hypothetical protein